ncbi:putative RNA-directed DNA polymerase [Helianthus annuus]|nr:putative RNA-directed DNA polymerase [Helianthus annuus]
MEWLRAGDSNTAYFHAGVKSRNHRSRIEVISDANGIMYEADNVHPIFVQHYEKFLGCQDDISMQPTPDLFSKWVNPMDASHMVRQVTREEVKTAMFSIGNDKAPGPDGYTTAFFKAAWPIVGHDVSNAVIDFFSTGKLFRELNHTLIALVPKKSSPVMVTDYRPIACCNVLFKCITKIIADRIKGVLHQVVSINQSAFIPGRKISDNILLTQELMHNYHRHSGPPRCAFEVDIQKAYDTVDRSFLKNVLIGFGVHAKMVEWIMVCVSTTSYSICINGNVHGYFMGKRGLRQGDPLSPYLFTLVMEVLTCILQHTSRIDASFKFHNKCEKQRTINLCFADDLFLFARGDVNSAKCIMSSLTNFSNMSGLLPSVQKSTGFFCNVPSHIKDHILAIMPFEEGMLPVRYLGVPLISSRLLYKDCSVLVERLDQRIMSWRNKLLSFAGRLQLINSVLSSMHVYWSSIYILPSRVILELEAKMRNFLWSSEGSFHKGKAKASWKSVCVPKFEGGLGIRRIGDVNKALMISHIWSILVKRESLWVAWIHSYRLRGKSFWICKSVSNCCWSWRKLLQLRPTIRDFVWSKLGDGSTTSAWYDYWCQIGPLGNFISPRSIATAGFDITSTVQAVQLNGVWRWPVAWRDLFPVLNHIDHVQTIPNKRDQLLGKDGNVFSEHSSSRVWQSLRHRNQEVDWVNLVWFPHCIPKHAFFMWLVIRRKLLTQDKILQWDISRRKNMNRMCCLLCYADVDSHSHLFFECSYSLQVWNLVRSKGGMDSVGPFWDDIVEWMAARARSKSAANYVSKLVLAAAFYFIWQERNSRLFKNQTRPPDVLSDAILQTVRYKLMVVKFKNTVKVRELLGTWEIHDTPLNAE